MEYTISQALRYASQLKAKISEARERAQKSLNYKEGSEPPFSFSEMMTKADELSDHLTEVQGALAVANALATVEYKDKLVTLSQAVRILQELKGKIAWVKGLSSLATDKVSSDERTWDDTIDKYVTTKVITCCSLPEAKRAELTDALQDEFNLLNGAVESMNQSVRVTI